MRRSGLRCAFFPPAQYRRPPPQSLYLPPSSARTNLRLKILASRTRALRGYRHPAWHHHSHRLSAAPPQNGGTALHFASKLGQLNLIDELLAKGAYIDAKDAEVLHSP